MRLRRLGEGLEQSGLPFISLGRLESVSRKLVCFRVDLLTFSVYVVFSTNDSILVYSVLLGPGVRV